MSIEVIINNFLTKFFWAWYCALLPSRSTRTRMVTHLSWFVLKSKSPCITCHPTQPISPLDKEPFAILCNKWNVKHLSTSQTPKTTLRKCVRHVSLKDELMQCTCLRKGRPMWIPLRHQRQFVSQGYYRYPPIHTHGYSMSGSVHHKLSFN